jgi:hypothetical protein
MGNNALVFTTLFDTASKARASDTEYSPFAHKYFRMKSYKECRNGH